MIDVLNAEEDSWRNVRGDIRFSKNHTQWYQALEILIFFLEI